MHWSFFFFDVLSRFQLGFGRLKRVAIYLLWFPSTPRFLRSSHMASSSLLLTPDSLLSGLLWICQLWGWCSQVKSASTCAWCSLASDSCFSLLSVISNVLCALDPAPSVSSLFPSLPMLHLQAAADTCVSTALLCRFTFAPSCPCFIPRQQLVFAFCCFSWASFTHAGPLLAFSLCLISWTSDLQGCAQTSLPQTFHLCLGKDASSVLSWVAHFFFLTTLCSECLCLCPWFLLSRGALVAGRWSIVAVCVWRAFGEWHFKMWK